VAFYAQIKKYVNPYLQHFEKKVVGPPLTRRERRLAAFDCLNRITLHVARAWSRWRAGSVSQSLRNLARGRLGKKISQSRDTE
jgi:hypothetical protein